MARNRNTNATGGKWTQQEIDAVWQKASKVDGLDPNIYRKDPCGSIIAFKKHGDVNSKEGWEIDHIKPVAKDGKDDLSNLQPLQWATNKSKSDTYPWKCGM